MDFWTQPNDSSSTIHTEISRWSDKQKFNELKIKEKYFYSKKKVCYLQHTSHTHTQERSSYTTTMMRCISHLHVLYMQKIVTFDLWDVC